MYRFADPEEIMQFLLLLLSILGESIVQDPHGEFERLGS